MLILVGFSNGYLLASKEQPRFFLDFQDSESGRGLRVPVPEETVRVLVREVYADDGTQEKSSPPPSPAPVEEQDVATEFGGNGDVEKLELQPTPGPDIFKLRRVGEEEVPSL